MGIKIKGSGRNGSQSISQLSPVELKELLGRTKGANRLKISNELTKRGL